LQPPEGYIKPDLPVPLIVFELWILVEDPQPALFRVVTRRFFPVHDADKKLLLRMKVLIVPLVNAIKYFP
jgi:hypothetical protein